MKQKMMKVGALLYFAMMLVVLVVVSSCAGGKAAGGGKPSGKPRPKTYSGKKVDRKEKAKTAGAAEYELLAEENGAPAPQPVTTITDTDEAEVDDAIRHNTEEYDRIYENPFLESVKNPLSTFSIDVDTASYANTRRFITRQGSLPYKDAVRIEEMINYFTYDYPEPQDNVPFNFITEIGDCPWNSSNRLLHIGLQAKKLDFKKFPPNNLVFLLDVSGSMSDPDKLPLLQGALKLLISQMRQQDRIAIVVYAGAAGVVLPSTAATDKKKIIAAIDNLSAGGSTAGGEGIKLAYKIAKENFDPKANNRVIIGTDGDFNVGVSSTSELERLIESKRKTGIYLTVLGFGMGNYKDSRMEKLADKGNGNYAYIDSMMEAKKVLVTEMGGTLLTIAKDVKLQIEFNPTKVKSYRLIGYENRMLRAKDFDDDKKDAGELGVGHTVTAIYEIVPADGKTTASDLKYSTTKVKDSAAMTDEIMTIKFRYKPPKSDKSILIVKAVKDKHIAWQNSSINYRFSAAVAEFGLLLRDSEYKGSATYKQVLDIAKKTKGKDPEGYRAEFIKIVDLAKGISGKK